MPDEAGQSDQDIVITATKAQVAAAKTAYDTADIMIDVFSIGLATFLGGAAAARGSVAAGASTAGGFEAFSQVRDGLVNNLADALYWADGRDGTFDGHSGVSAANMALSLAIHI